MSLISGATATKHPKVLVAELCSVISALIEEIDRIDKKPVFVPKPTPEPIAPDSGKDGPLTRPSQPWETNPSPRRRTTKLPDDRPMNAGDAT